VIRALIADDEVHLARFLQEQLAILWPELIVLDTARDGVEAAAKIAELEPDVVFLDVQMPGYNGLEVAQGIETDTRVVFVTAYDDYAVEAFEHAAIDYLLKPVTTDRLARTVERVKASLVRDAAVSPESPDARMAGALSKLLGRAVVPPRLTYIRAAQGELMHQIALDDVLFFHADDKYTVVQTAAGEHLIRTTITELAQRLDPERFCQIHRSTLINLAHLAGTRRSENSRLFVRIKGSPHELPVSRAFVHLFKPM
jgi:DNA-binding LytR/AlgR family response regulator